MTDQDLRELMRGRERHAPDAAAVLADLDAALRARRIRRSRLIAVAAAAVVVVASITGLLVAGLRIGDIPDTAQQPTPLPAAPPLVGTTWRLEDSIVIETLTIDTNGQFYVRNGCRGMKAIVLIDDETLTLTSIELSSGPLCPTDPRLYGFVNADRPIPWKQEGDVLILTDPVTGTESRYVPQQPASTTTSPPLQASTAEWGAKGQELIADQQIHPPTGVANDEPFAYQSNDVDVDHDGRYTFTFTVPPDFTPSPDGGGVLGFGFAMPDDRSFDLQPTSATTVTVNPDGRAATLTWELTASGVTTPYPGFNIWLHN